MSDKQENIFFANLEANIRQQAKQMGVTLSDLAKNIEMTEAGFYKMLSTDSIKLKTLKKIAEVLKKPVSFFIDHTAKKGVIYSSDDSEMSVAAEPHTIYQVEKDGLVKQIKLLESQLKDKEKIIELLSKNH
ncbi:helix-turn-helix domain-containing protein [Mucilaginibacter lacusdianchii]|uniref:helix-turn-helix domain-containing protein n=1 Tax=Mucilaginibacter lacusdianchii TaxID=2684211 RepID=UPI00131D0D2F|nr:helix-turn-helix transcriptional regulator [Mucilaginibacter sp. JXJ CY 39]